MRRPLSRQQLRAIFAQKEYEKEKKQRRGRFIKGGLAALGTQTVLGLGSQAVGGHIRSKFYAGSTSDRSVKFANKVIRDMGLQKEVRAYTGSGAFKIIGNMTRKSVGLNKIMATLTQHVAYSSPLYFPGKMLKGRKFGVISSGFMDDEAIILHELGHHIDYRKFGQVKMMLRIFSPLTALVAVGASHAAYKHLIQKRNRTNVDNRMLKYNKFVIDNAPLVIGIGASPILWQEAKASLLAIRKGRKYGISVGRSLKTLGPAYASYAMVLSALPLALYSYQLIAGKFSKNIEEKIKLKKMEKKLKKKR